MCHVSGKQQQPLENVAIFETFKRSKDTLIKDYVQVGLREKIPNAPGKLLKNDFVY